MQARASENINAPIASNMTELYGGTVWLGINSSTDTLMSAASHVRTMSGCNIATQCYALLHIGKSSCAHQSFIDA